MDALLVAGSPGSGLLALQVIAGIGERAGWPPEWRQRLELLRAHPAVEVRSAARDTATAAE